MVEAAVVYDLDETIARQIDDALNALNIVLDEAARAGLYVEIENDRTELCTVSGGCRIYHGLRAKIERRTTIR